MDGHQSRGCEHLDGDFDHRRIFAATRVQQEFLPNAELDEVYVTVAYPGASPDEVEQGILLAIEEAVRGLNGVKRVVSYANENSGTVRAEVLEKSDVNRVADDVRNAVDRIRTFPSMLKNQRSAS